MEHTRCVVKNQHIIYKRSRLHHAPGTTTGAEAATFNAEATWHPDQMLMAAAFAAHSENCLKRSLIHGVAYVRDGLDQSIALRGGFDLVSQLAKVSSISCVFTDFESLITAKTPLCHKYLNWSEPRSHLSDSLNRAFLN